MSLVKLAIHFFEQSLQSPSVFVELTDEFDGLSFRCMMVSDRGEGIEPFIRCQPSSTVSTEDGENYNEIETRPPYVICFGTPCRLDMGIVPIYEVVYLFSDIKVADIVLGMCDLYGFGKFLANSKINRIFERSLKSQMFVRG